MQVKRVGVFGGTFDPPHIGHLIVAEHIRETFGLEEMYFMPCNQPPHKQRDDLSDAKHRFAMVVAATLHNPAFMASPIEVNRPGKSYSIDTLQELAGAMGENVEIVFVSGLDAFLEIETWKDHEQILDLCHMVVVGRPGHRFDEVAGLPEWIRERIVDRRAGGEAGAPCFPEQGRRIFLSEAVLIDLSSTDIRGRIAAGRSVRYMVPAEVERYIRSHGLYRPVDVPQEVAS